MSWLRHWKIALCMAAIFVAGGVTGSVLTVRAVRAFVNRQATPEAWLTTMVRGYEKKLKLTSEQAQKLKPSFDQAGMELRRARASTMMDYVEIVQRLQEEIGRELTPDQQKLFEDIKREGRERFRERFNSRQSK